jgi:hypothetical protein
MAFCVALFALAAAGVGTIVNHWLTGWMAVGGMVGLGLFYLAVGILNLKTDQPVFEDETMQNVSHRAARVENLVGEAVTRPRLNLAFPPDSPSRQQSKNMGGSAEISELPPQMKRKN